MGNKITLSPSLLGGDFSNIRKSVNEIVKSGCRYIHLDIMDGNFVPNISFGPALINSIKDFKSSLYFDAHLMIEKPERFINDFANSGCDAITIHPESTYHPHRVLQKIKSLNIESGISLNPGTSVSSIEYLLYDCDLVLVMSVNPGFGGQSLIESTLIKIKELANIRENKNLNFKISIDGGVNLDTVKKVKKMPIDIIVAGSAFFSAEDKINFRKEIEK